MSYVEVVEEWEVVEGWEYKYAVSNTGRVWNTFSDVEVSQVITGIPQYKYVNLRHKGIHRLVRVHRLVALAFCENSEPDKYTMVDHQDRDKFNNNSKNLKWTDRFGNGRNLERNLYMGSVFLKDFVLKYDNPDAAYTYLAVCLGSGLSEEDSVSKYQANLEHGMKRIVVEWQDKEILLNELCNTYGIEYHEVSSRISSGWPVWNAVYNIPLSYYKSFQLVDSKGVYHWYPDNDKFESSHPTVFGIWKTLMNQGKNLDQILQWDGKDHLRQTVMGVYGTIQELCDHFNRSGGAVLSKMSKKGMTLEQAINAPMERVKRISINGVYNTPKYWYESFGLEAKKTNSIKSKNSFTFKETFEHCGVDTSEMIIETV